MSESAKPASNVIPISRLADTGEPDPDIIKRCEELLARAKAGQMRAFSFAFVDGGNFCNTGFDLGSTKTGLLVAATDLLRHRLMTFWDEEPGFEVAPPPAS